MRGERHMLRMPQTTPSSRLNLTLTESLSCFEQALSPIAFHKTNEFQPTTHLGNDRPENGTSPSIGYFQEVFRLTLHREFAEVREHHR